MMAPRVMVVKMPPISRVWAISHSRNAPISRTMRAMNHTFSNMVWAFYNDDPILMCDDAHWSVRRVSNNGTV